MEKTKRKAVSAKTRFDVFKRDGFACMYCGAHPPEVLLHLDHVHPVALGGSNDEDNLITSCERCNLGKGAVSLSTVPVSLVDKAKDVAEREKQIRGYQEVMDARRQRLDDEQWSVAGVFMQHFREDYIRKDWLASIKRFIEGLGVHSVIDAAELAVARKGWSKNTAFKYFCGICWNKLRESNGPL